MFGAGVEAPASSNPRRGRKWYFERLEVQTIKCNVTLIPRPGSRDVESGLSPGRIRMAATLGVNFIDINNVPLKINALAFQNALMSPSILMSHITRHLINSVSIAVPAMSITHTTKSLVCISRMRLCLCLQRHKHCLFCASNVAPLMLVLACKSKHIQH